MNYADLLLAFILQLYLVIHVFLELVPWERVAHFYSALTSS